MDRVSFYRKVDRIKLLVQTKSTGSPVQLAQRLEVSERTVYRLLDATRELYQVEIFFSHVHNSYVLVDSSNKNESLPEFGST